MKHHLLFFFLVLILTASASDYIPDFFEEDFPPEQEEPLESDIDYSNNLARIALSEEFDQTAFKMFEQLKGYNNKLAEFSKLQKDLIVDLKQLEL